MPRLDERRLLDVVQTAAYLGGLSEDSVRELDASGVLTPARVRIPGRGQPMRKVLFDRVELDRLVAGWRTPADPPGVTTCRGRLNPGGGP